MLDRVAFKNFKSLKDVSLELTPSTVLVGPNGSGKSSVLLGMHMLSQVGVFRENTGSVWGRLGDVFGGPLATQRLASRRGPTLMALSMWASGDDELSLLVSIPGEGDSYKEVVALEYVVTVEGAGRRHEVTIPPREPVVGRPLDAPLDHALIRQFTSVARLHLDPTTMAGFQPRDARGGRFSQRCDGRSPSIRPCSPTA